MCVCVDIVKEEKKLIAYDGLSLSLSPKFDTNNHEAAVMQYRNKFLTQC